MVVSGMALESKSPVSMPSQERVSTTPAYIFVPGRLVHTGKTKTGETVEIRVLAQSDQDIHPEFSGKKITEVLKDDIVLVARINGVFVGSCLAERYGGAYINNLDVLPDHRNKGIGSAMLDAMVIIARELGSEYLSLSSDHPDPVRLYLRKGFVDTRFCNGQGEIYRLLVRSKGA